MGERPIAYVVRRNAISEDKLQAHLLERFPKWWLPDRIVFIKSIPKTTTGKFDKKVLREEFKSKHGTLPVDE